MDANRWKEVRALFDELVDLDAAQRGERLSALGSTDPELRDAVGSLLATDLRSSGAIGIFARDQSPVKGDVQDPLGLVGRVTGRFRLIEALGVGGMGVVYRADDTQLGRPVALKFLLPQLQLDPSARKRFLHEARSAAMLEHANICAVHEIGEDSEGRPFLAMPLYAGETLKQRLARTGPLPPNEAVHIARQIAAGLECAHSAGVVHRDLKPGKLMLLPDGAVKILDFGLAKSRDLSLTTSGATLGTVAYMAPEQIERGTVDGRADLWALGVVLYEMLTGNQPFQGDSGAAVSHAVVHDTPVPLAKLCPELRVDLAALTERLLTKDPEGRPVNAAALLKALAGSPSDQAGHPRFVHRRLPTRLHRANLPRLITYLAGTAALGGVAWFAVGMWGGGATSLDPRLVMVAPFANLTGDSSIDVRATMATHWITLGLTEHSIADVVDFAMDAPGVRDGSMLRELAVETGAGLVVWGSYLREGKGIQLIARITDVDRGTVLREFGPYQGSVAGPLEELAELRSEVLGALAMHLNPQDPLETVPGQSPPGFEAYQAYLEGYAALMHLDFAAWMEGARRALALDSTFLQITGELTWSYIALEDCAPIDSIWQQFQTRRDQIPESIRLEVAQTAALCRRDFEGSYRAAERWLSLVPYSEEARLCLAFAGIWAGRLREAEQQFRNMDLTRGLHATNPFTDQNYLDVLHLLGRFEEALRVAEQARDRHPHFVRSFYFGLDALAALGRVSEMEALIAESENSVGPGEAGDIYRDMADELSWHGYDAAARRFAMQAIEAFDQLSISEQETPFYLAQRAGALLHLERWEAIRESLDGIPLVEGVWHIGDGRPANQGQILALRGIAAAKSGDATGAQGALRAIAELPGDEGPHYYRTREFWEAQVLAALGEDEEALRRLQLAQMRGGLSRSDPRITHDEPGMKDLWHDPRFELLFAAR